MFNWLLRPWITPRLQLTGIDELLGVVEMLVLFAIGFFIAILIIEIRDLIRYRK